MNYFISFTGLKAVFGILLNKINFIKTKYLRANSLKFMKKELSKAIMLRNKLRNELLKKTASRAKLKYKKQENLWVDLIRKPKREFLRKPWPKWYK